jgi:hypothetical protein
MKNMLLAMLLPGLLTVAVGVQAQLATSQNLYFVKKHRAVEFGKEDYQPGKKAFYLYRNCLYNVVLRNKMERSIRVVDIANDSVYYTLYFNQNAADKQHARFDTLSLHPGELKKIRLIADRILGLFGSCSLRNRRYVFDQSSEAKAFPRVYDTLYTADSSRSALYEIVPYMTAQGLDHVYEQCGNTYYYQGITPAACDSPQTVKPRIRKKGVWFTPSAANEIKGVNIGFETMQWNEDSLAIKGLNLCLDPMALFTGFYALIAIGTNNTLINMPDTVKSTPSLYTIKGVSLSGGGLLFNTETRGVAINGILCAVEKTNGLVITGSQNLIYEFKGVTISGLRNNSIKGSGVQIGLLNICKHLKGVQIGLWNVNSKRKLPFINWSL